MLLAIPSGGLTVRSFFAAMAEQGLEKEHYTGAWEVGAPLPWDIVQSGVSENFFHYELRLASQSRTGLSCPPDSAGCLACQACDRGWDFRYGDNANRPVPAAMGAPRAARALAAVDAGEGGRLARTRWLSGRGVKGRVRPSQVGESLPLAARYAGQRGSGQPPAADPSRRAAPDSA